MESSTSETVGGMIVFVVTATALGPPSSTAMA
jgi:hypothetical protein